MIKKLQLRNSDKYTLLDTSDFNRIKNAKWYLSKIKGKEYVHSQVRLKNGKIIKPLTLSQVAKLRRPKKGRRFISKNLFPPEQKLVQVFLHRFIMDAPKGLEVDHINGNGLDNRRKNLRLCDRTGNVRNRSISSNNTSGVTGVYFATSEKRKKRWVANIRIGKGKRITLGRFLSKEEAIITRKKAEVKYFGEFRRKEA